MADANLQIVIDAVDNASKDLNNLKKQLKGITTETDKTTKATGNLADGFKSFLSTAGMVAAGVTAGYFALKKFYDIAKQGAELQFVEDRFNRLAESVGTTADVLLGDLRTATKGLRSDSELMASATDFMALGFAKTADEAVRLATVAGALNMNMNQLVLTLANQTTMRFDQLGVAVEGFDERLQALKATGMDTNAAFKEAFLQQAEAQVKKVGNAADTSVSNFMKLESAVKNLGDAFKSDFAQSIEGVIPLLTQVATGMVETQRRGVEYRSVMEQLNTAVQAGVVSQIEYTKLLKEMGVHSNAGAVSAAALQKAIEFLNAAYGSYAGTVDMTAENTIALAIADAQLKQKLDEIPEATAAASLGVLNFAASSERAAFAVDNFLEKAGIFKDDFAEIFSLSKNLNGMINFAQSYDDITAQIEANNLKIAASSGAMKDELLANNAKLQQSLTDMANQVTLDMFQATIAVGGVTQAEMQAYFQMAEDMGLISEAGAQAAMDAYNNAITTINGYEIEEKTGNVVVDALAAMATLDFLQSYALADKEMRVFIRTYYGSSGDPDPQAGSYNPANGQPVYARAAGGMTLPHYWVGELGPEPFFPETNGRIVSNTQALSALRSGAEGGGSSQPLVININTPVNLADRVWVERELAPYIRNELRKAGK